MNSSWGNSPSSHSNLNAKRLSTGMEGSPAALAFTLIFISLIAVALIGFVSGALKTFFGGAEAV
jgi:hypothetical protein